MSCYGLTMADEDGAMRRFGRMDWIGLLAGVLVIVVLYGGAFWVVHRFLGWVMDDPLRLLIAIPLAIGCICIWAVIGLASSLLTALLTR